MSEADINASHLISENKTRIVAKCGRVDAYYYVVEGVKVAKVCAASDLRSVKCLPNLWESGKAVFKIVDKYTNHQVYKVKPTGDGVTKVSMAYVQQGEDVALQMEHVLSDEDFSELAAGKCINFYDCIRCKYAESNPDCIRRFAGDCPVFHDATIDRPR